MNKLIRLSALALPCLIFASCATSPISVGANGATQVDLSPKPQSSSLIQKGVQTFEAYKKSKKQVSNAQVTRVGNRLKRVVPLQGAQWEFATFENATPNAFALPGGKIGVHTGILPIAQSDAGLATILAHEIAHVSLNHHQQRANTLSLIHI